jgi:hypothetical protein
MFSNLLHRHQQKGETEGANGSSLGYPVRALIPEGSDKCLQ